MCESDLNGKSPLGQGERRLSSPFAGGPDPNNVPQECPAPETIVGYALKQVPHRVRDRVFNHLQVCPHCRVEVEALGEALEVQDHEAGQARSDDP